MKLRVKKKKFKQILLQNGVEFAWLPFVRQYEMNMKYAHLPYPFYHWPTHRRPLNFTRATRYGHCNDYKLPKNWYIEMKNYNNEGFDYYE
jgi:hypothetical protein